MDFDVPEEVPWSVISILFGEEYAQEWRAELDDIERFENEGGPCV